LAGGPEGAAIFPGNLTSGGAAASVPLSETATNRQSLGVDYEKRGFRDNATRFDRSHLLYRFASDLAGGTLRFDGDVTVLGQSPASPHVRDGSALSTATPLDANYNPSNGKLNQNRYHAVIGFDIKAADMPWSTTLAFTRGDHNIVRGFLTDLSDNDPNATGFQQKRSVTDVY